MKDDLLRQLALISNRFSTYHNHKENSAWAAAALYIGLALLIARQSEATVSSATIATVMVAAFGVGVWKFMHIQDGLRLIGYRTEAACDRLMCQIAAGRAVTADDCQPGEVCSGKPVNDFRFPRALIAEYQVLTDSPPHARKNLLEWVRYLVVAAALLSAAAVWVRVIVLP